MEESMESSKVQTTTLESRLPDSIVRVLESLQKKMQVWRQETWKSVTLSGILTIAIPHPLSLSLFLSFQWPVIIAARVYPVL